jgi:hypothetical protein
MVLMRENESTWIKTCASATLPTTNPTHTILGLNMFLCGETGD